MGTYINKGNIGFRKSRNGEYVDKTRFIAVVNATIDTEDQYICATRCRRFGKSMMARTLCAYYDRSCDSRELFRGLEIEQDPSFETHLNRYNVLYLDVTDFTTQPEYRGHIVESINTAIIKEVKAAFPAIEYDPEADLMGCLQAIYNQAGERFYFIIDEWDAICREFPQRQQYQGTTCGTEPTEMDQYVMFLRRLFKSQASGEVFVGAYLTGILPMIKYDTESALNNFREYSMVMPRGAAGSFGFTDTEVQALCDKHGMDYDEMTKWYDGYQIGDQPSVFNPNSVMNAIASHECHSFWAATGAYDRVASYIDMNFHGLKDDIIAMLAGGRCMVEVSKFTNDMHDIRSKNDVFTILVHLGYLAYDNKKEECYIPNLEVKRELENAIENNHWRIAETISNSRALLMQTLAGDAEAVAKAIDRAHDDNTSILSYNNENSLACVLTIAYLYAQNDYIIHRELPTGKGFADLVLIPRKHVDSPAIVIELKYNLSAETAIDQIKRKQYTDRVAEYLNSGSQQRNILLVGINYDKATKTHTCAIETI